MNNIRWKKYYTEEEEKSLMQKAKDFATDAVKKKIVSILTGGQVLSSIGLILDILQYVPGINFDRSVVDEKLNTIISSLQGGVEDIDAWLKKIPMLETLFGDEKDFLKNVCRFGAFVCAINIGTYPSDKFNMATVLSVQSTLLAIIILTIVTGSAWITATFGVGLWISCAAFNKVFSMVEDDIKQFEKWTEEHNMDSKEINKEVLDGKTPAEFTSADKDKEQVNEFVGALIKGAGKLAAKGIGKMLGKGAAKTAAKTATKTAAKKTARTLTGKVAQKLAPTALKGLRKVSAFALKKMRGISPRTAQFLRKQSPKIVEYCIINGLSDREILGYIGDFISDCYSQASEQDKPILDVMKNELSRDGESGKAIIAKFNELIDGTPSQEEQKQAAESTVRKLKITKGKFTESRYFKTKYGKLEYVSESGDTYKTTKGHVIQFK